MKKHCCFIFLEVKLSLLAGTCAYHKLSRVEKRNCISPFHTQGKENETGAGERNKEVKMFKSGWPMQLGKLQGDDQTAELDMISWAMGRLEEDVIINISSFITSLIKKCQTVFQLENFLMGSCNRARRTGSMSNSLFCVFCLQLVDCMAMSASPKTKIVTGLGSWLSWDKPRPSTKSS